MGDEYGMRCQDKLFLHPTLREDGSLLEEKVGRPFDGLARDTAEEWSGQLQQEAAQ